MKIRNGFVSNSSSSSFTIYGWTEKIFKETLGTVSPLLEGMEIYIDEWKMIDNLEKLWEDQRGVDCCDDADGFKVFGIGTSGTEIDHYIDDYQNFYYDEPSDENKAKLDKIAEKLGMPKPQIYKGNFYA